MTTLQWHKGLARRSACPICADSGEKQVLLTAGCFDRPSRNTGETLDLMHCRNCGARYYDPLFLASDEEEGSGDAEGNGDGDGFPASVKFYIEHGAGIETMLTPLTLIDGRLIHRVVEVGCNFGFLTHYAQQILGWDITGYDPGPAGKIGSALLALPIQPREFDKTGHRPNSIDLFYASEVIEHIPQPREFLRTVRDVLKPSGLLVMTTPNADVVQPAMAPEMITALSPGAHVILYAERTLERLLTEAGFAHFRFDSSENQICVCASIAPFSGSSCHFSAELYRSYLESAAASQPQGSILRLGFEYRLFKALVNRGDYQGGRALYQDIRVSIRERYAFDPDDIEPSRFSASGPVAFNEFSARWPFSLSGILFFRGVIEHLEEQRYAHAAVSFRGAIAFGRSVRAALQQIGSDDLETVETCREAELALVGALVWSDPDAVVPALADVERNQMGLNPMSFAAHRGRVRRQAFIDLVNLGHLEPARQILEAAGSFAAPPLTEATAPAAVAEAKFYTQVAEFGKAHAIFEAVRGTAFADEALSGAAAEMAIAEAQAEPGPPPASQHGPSRGGLTALRSRFARLLRPAR